MIRMFTLLHTFLLILPDVFSILLSNFLKLSILLSNILYLNVFKQFKEISRKTLGRVNTTTYTNG